MARLTFTGDMGWMDYQTSGPEGLTLTVKPKRWYALRPSFWLFAARHLRLRPYRSEALRGSATAEEEN